MIQLRAKVELKVTPSIVGEECVRLEDGVYYFMLIAFILGFRVRLKGGVGSDSSGF